MPPFWKRLWGRSSPPQPTNLPETEPDPAPAEPVDTNPMEPAEAADYPNTYRPGAEDGPERPQVFEPALQQFPHAFRRGDPVFPDDETRRVWYAARRGVLDHLLRSISESPWKDHLVLRGSLLLRAWLGEAAREPGDMDWVFRPQTVGIDDPTARELFAGFIQMASERPQAGSAVIAADEAAVDEIWTYERAAGRRIVFPWHAEGLPPGTVQMDVVFGEALFADPIQTLIPSPGGGSVPVWSADQALSLAWKLLWLETDIYPQGKDLYDATLLAERTHLPFDLLRRVLESSEDAYRNPAAGLRPDFPLQWEVDWENFKLEYPWVAGEAKDWQARLARHLAPTFQR